MSKTVLPEDFQNKLNIVCILANKFNVKIKKFEFSSIGSWDIECCKGEDYYTNLAVIKICFTEDGVEGKFYEYKDSTFSKNFSFLKLFDNDSWYAYISKDKIADYYFKDETGVYHRMTNFNKINITYSDDEVNAKTSSKKM